MGIEHLAEAIIVQSLEDVWSRTRRDDGISFFHGEGFKVYAPLAGMKVIDRLRFLKMLRGLNGSVFSTSHSRRLRDARLTP